jgi:hypothetical protein
MGLVIAVAVNALAVSLMGSVLGGGVMDPLVPSAEDALLNALVGEWDLTGSMGQTALAQAVSADWVLNHQFLRIAFRDRNPPRAGAVPYEAVVYIGREQRSGRYVMHLLDVFGAEYSKTLGVGVRDGDAITFVFEYPDRPFSARYAWNAAERVWNITITYRDKTGVRRLFAEKRLKRATDSR